MWKFLTDKFKFRKHLAPVQTVDDEGFHEVRGGEPEKCILWSQIENVDILTTSGGPILDDLFYIIRGNDTYICIDQFKAQELSLLDRFKRLPGFNWEEVLKSAACVEDRSFACWDKKWEQAVEPVK